jgi:superfamily II DNA helicase RecQ
MAMSRVIELRSSRTEADKVSFMVLTATPTKEILDHVYEVAGFTRPDHRVLYIRKTLNRPNIFLEIKQKTSFEASILASDHGRIVIYN